MAHESKKEQVPHWLNSSHSVDNQTHTYNIIFNVMICSMHSDMQKGLFHLVSWVSTFRIFLYFYIKMPLVVLSVEKNKTKHNLQSKKWLFPFSENAVFLSSCLECYSFWRIWNLWQLEMMHKTFYSFWKIWKQSVTALHPTTMSGFKEKYAPVILLL